MITMNELVDLRMEQQIAHEMLYRQQIMQRIPDPFAAIMPNMHFPPQMLIPQHPLLLLGVEAKLENSDLWQRFHKVGTEMIITKSGRRMFPSMRFSLKGLEDEHQYCVLIEMVPMGDCRYKFSGSQWVPAGGAEPQSPQRMFLHPDSPATGSHWQAQPILFNKVKLTNNTLDNNGHIVLTSMHKYQPRIHVVRTNDLSHTPWAPQQAFVFPETEFVAVTAYQNDRITKLKIDNNPFAKGFRETGQSKCKRKMSLSPSPSDEQQNNSLYGDDDQSSVASSQDSWQNKRVCIREELLPRIDLNNVMHYTLPPHMGGMIATPAFLPHIGQQGMPMFMNNLPSYMEPISASQIYHHNINSEYGYTSGNEETFNQTSSSPQDEQNSELFVDVVNTSSEDSEESSKHLNPCIVPISTPVALPSTPPSSLSSEAPVKRNSFSISSILGISMRNPVSV